jgi:hypothetical protein
MKDPTDPIAELMQQRNALAENGYILGYITASKPGKRPNFTQYHLREYGQKVGKYISKKRLDEVRAMVQRGAQIKALDEAIAMLQKTVEDTAPPPRFVRESQQLSRRRNRRTNRD